MKDIINKIRNDLEKNSDRSYRERIQYSFKEKINFRGVRMPIVVKLATQYFENIKNLEKKEIFTLCEELWQSGYLEESFIACNWSYSIRKQYEQKDFEVIEKWVNKYVSNWASCDTLCNHTIGSFVEMYPSYVSNLKKWAKSKNRWVRRASAVSLIIPARHGKFLTDIFEIANVLLLDQDDLVQKGYGWMLKAASQTHQSQVFDYVVRNKMVMPRTALRYAIEKMPKSLKERAMIT
ncbi:MAG: DNA alkylation repair protein [Patescibacteria group bacterium]